MKGKAMQAFSGMLEKEHLLDQDFPIEAVHQSPKEICWELHAPAPNPAPDSLGWEWCSDTPTLKKLLQLVLTHS